MIIIGKREITLTRWQSSSCSKVGDSTKYLNRNQNLFLSKFMAKSVDRKMVPIWGSLEKRCWLLPPVSDKDSKNCVDERFRKFEKPIRIQSLFCCSWEERQKRWRTPMNFWFQPTCSWEIYIIYSWTNKFISKLNASKSSSKFYLVKKWPIFLGLAY